MRYTIFIPQLGVVRAGLAGQLSLADLAVLAVLRDMTSMNRAVRIVADQRQFTWAHYPHVISELPVVFNHAASPRTLKNQLRNIIGNLRVNGLVETKLQHARLYFRLTDLAMQIYSERGARKQPETVTPGRDTPVTQAPNGNGTTKRDGAPLPNINDPGTNEQGTIGPDNLPSSLQTEADVVMAFWNSHPQLQTIRQFTERRLKSLAQRLADEFFRANWRTGIERIAGSPFCCGKGPRGWQANVEWFLRPETLTKLMEGYYDSSKGHEGSQPKFTPGSYDATSF